jgi:parvulin-like peptidyl-prolyl isomerase
LWQVPPGEWTGPLQSQYGWHYVLVSERLPPELLPFDAVRQQVENDLLLDTIAAAVGQHVQQALPGYEVQVER